MGKEAAKRILTDTDIKRKAVKLVISHIKKKTAKEYIGSEYINEWISGMEALLDKQNFNVVEYLQARKELSNIIERILDEEIRYKLRDSWYSLGKALDKKVKLK